MLRAWQQQAPPTGPMVSSSMHQIEANLLWGLLIEGGPQCRMSILRNGNVAVTYFPQCHMSNIGKKLCPMSLHFYLSPDVACRVSNLRNTHVPLSFLGVNATEGQAHRSHSIFINASDIGQPALGALDGGVGGGSPMSHVDFKKWQCCSHLFSSMSHVAFKERLCPMSLHFYLSPHEACHYNVCRVSNLKNAHVTLLIFRGQGNRRPSP